MKSPKKFVLTFKVDIPIEATSKQEAQKIFQENRTSILDYLINSVKEEIRSDDRIWRKVRPARR